MEAQKNAFLEGFFELIPRDLIIVFDERELEVCLSKFGKLMVTAIIWWDCWNRCGRLGAQFRVSGVQQRRHCHSKLLEGNIARSLLTHRLFADGIPRKKLDYYSLSRVLLVFLSTDSKICMEATVLENSPSKRQERWIGFQKHILGIFAWSTHTTVSIASIYLHIKTLNLSTLNSH